MYSSWHHVTINFINCARGGHERKKEMRLYSIKLESGEIFSGNYGNIAEVATEFPEAEKIERLDKDFLAKRVKTLNGDLASISYLTLGEIDSFFQRVLTEYGFEYPVESIFEIGRTNEGRINTNIGGVYLTVVWYKMPSGKFEIVSYVN
jgi:hypothetical protein